MNLSALRRMALRATREPELRPVLEDAFLESPLGPEFEKAIQEAHANVGKWPALVHIVFFYPFAALGMRILPREWAHFFDVFGFRYRDLDLTDPESRLRQLIRFGYIPVYEALVPQRFPSRRSVKR